MKAPASRATSAPRQLASSATANKATARPASRTSGIVQRQLQTVISNSPRQVAQQQAIVQLRGSNSTASQHSKPIQRVLEPIMKRNLSDSPIKDKKGNIVLKSSGLLAGNRTKINKRVEKCNKATSTTEKEKLFNEILELCDKWKEEVFKKKCKETNSLKKEALDAKYQSIYNYEISVKAERENALVQVSVNNRTHRLQEDGGLYPADYMEQVQKWIGKQAQLIRKGDYTQAYQNLVVKTNPFSQNLNVIVKPDDGDPQDLAKKNSAVNSKKTLYLNASNDISWLTPTDAASKLNTEKILLMHLEEYMHFYQAKANKFISPNTIAFKQSKELLEVDDKGVRAVEKDGTFTSYDEIDVFAAFKDWGFDVEAMKLADHYGERKKYDEWQKNKQKTVLPLDAKWALQP